MDIVEVARKGGKARVRKLSKKEHSELGRKAANTRWANHRKNNGKR